MSHGTTEDFEVVPVGAMREIEQLKERVKVLESRLEFSNSLKDYWREVAEKGEERIAKLVKDVPVQFRG